MRRLARPTLALLLLVAPALAAACATPGHQRLPSLGVAELSERGEQLLRVTVDSYFFEPNRLVVKVGVPVRMTLVNETIFTGHDFSLFAPEAGLQVNAYVPAREEIEFEFLPEAVGEYEFYCNIADHSEHGMTGTLEVVERLPGEPIR